MRVAYVRYDPDEWEPLVYVDPSFIPRVGDSVSLPEGDDDTRCWRVNHVCWIPALDQVEIGVS
jgi:hypothetical protein